MATHTGIETTTETMEMEINNKTVLIMLNLVSSRTKIIPTLLRMVRKDKQKVKNNKTIMTKSKKRNLSMRRKSLKRPKKS